MNEFTGDIRNFPNIYRVTGDPDEYGIPVKIDSEKFMRMLSGTLVRVKGVSVLPVIFKFLREWALKAGKIYPDVENQENR